MFHDDGSEKAAVEVMHYLWTDEWPENRAPRIEAFTINGLNALHSIILEENKVHTAKVEASDPDGDPFHVEWELLPELDEFAAYAGQRESKPDSIEDFIVSNGETKKEIEFRVPADADRTYRLFIYIYDGHGNVGVANIPFYLRPE